MRQRTTDSSPPTWIVATVALPAVLIFLMAVVVVARVPTTAEPAGPQSAQGSTDGQSADEERAGAEVADEEPAGAEVADGDAPSAGLAFGDAPEFGPLAERSVILAPGGRQLATLHGVYNRRSVELEAVPDHVWQAVVVAEDRRFFDHGGYDVRAIGRAAMTNVLAWEVVEGGSTITQQLAKTFVGTEITLDRKIRELRVALALESRYEKEELLERYLNEVYFGSGAYGVAAAAEEFFDVPLQELTVDQAAMLAGMIRSPAGLNPRRKPVVAQQRRNEVLAGMAEEGYLDEDAAFEATLRPVEPVPTRDERYRDPYLVAAIKREFQSNPAFGENRQERARKLLRGGLQIVTTIDVDLQRRATALIRERFPGGQGPTAAIAAVDPATGAVRAAAYGRHFRNAQFNPAIQGRRQPGSAFKTFVLAAALEQGLPLSTRLEGTSGSRFGTPGTTGDWATRGVRNFGDASYGTVSARYALVRSVNTAFADLILRVGAEAVLDLTDRLGIPRKAYGGLENAGIALGGLDRGVSPLEMASAYATFSNNGVSTRPHVIHQVRDRNGQEIYRADPRPQQALDPAITATMLQVLTDAVSRGTGTRAQLPGRQVAGKTGTTQDNEDVWFAGTTPQLSAAVWVGQPDRRVPLEGMSSSRTAAPLWRAFMQLALDGVEPTAYRGGEPAPAG